MRLCLPRPIDGNSERGQRRERIGCATLVVLISRATPGCGKVQRRKERQKPCDDDATSHEHGPCPRRKHETLNK